MPDQYIEIEWNGVRTVAKVAATLPDYTYMVDMGDVAPPLFIWKTPAMKVGLRVGSPEPRFDADSEYDRDVRGE